MQKLIDAIERRVSEADASVVINASHYLEMQDSKE